MVVFYNRSVVCGKWRQVYSRVCQLALLLPNAYTDLYPMRTPNLVSVQLQDKTRQRETGL